jgi:stage II sporulation protein AA (anti-sigma F factor antagonist)
MVSTAPFSLRIDVRNDVANIALNGELDLATVPLLDARLAQLERDGVKALMLDLRDLSFLDSSGIDAFVSARESAQRTGHGFVLIGASPWTRQLFGLTGTEFLLEEQDPAEVLGQFTHSQSYQACQPVADVHTHAV